MATMAKHPWLTQRGSVFYLRAPVPKDIIATFGKGEVTYSLGTKDRAEATRKYRAEAKKVAELFEEHRQIQSLDPANLDPPTVPPPSIACTQLDNATLRSLCDCHYQRIIDAEFAERSDLIGKVRADVEGFRLGSFIGHPTTDWYLAFYEELSTEERLLCCHNERQLKGLGAAQHALALGDCTHHQLAVDLLLSERGLVFTAADQLRLIHKIIETEVAAHQAILAKDARRYDAILASHGAPVSSVPLQSNAVQSIPSGPDLASVVEAFLDEGNRGGLVKKTTMSDKTDIREFIEIVGNKPVRTYTPADGTKYKETLLSTPSLRKGLGIVQAAAKADQDDPTGKIIPRLHVDTINDKLMVIRKLFRWIDGREKKVPSLVEGIRIKTKRRRGNKVKKRAPFTVEELNKLFRGPVFTGCKSKHRWKEPGRLVPRDSARFWAPLIALFTGMRLGEIIQLRVADRLRCRRARITK